MTPLSHIMLVEDEPDIREIAQMSLEALGGFQVTACASGQEALERVAAIKPQLILLDVMMPDMDGIMTITQLKTCDDVKDIPVIFMTARVQSTQIDHYLELGAIGTLAKPFDPITLPDAIKTLWKKHVG